MHRQPCLVDEGLRSQFKANGLSEVLPDIYCKTLQLVTYPLKARARLRELHADILAHQLAAAEAAIDVRTEMGWDAEDAEVRTQEQQTGTLCQQCASVLQVPACVHD